MADTNNVSAAKPKVGGAISTAALGTLVPEDAKSVLGEDYANLGYISDDGLTNEITRESESVKAWGGTVVASLQTEKSDKFTYKLIEITNIDVLKEVFGQKNVKGSLEEGIKVTVNSDELDERVIVIDMILKGGILKRVVIPKGKIIEMSEVTYKDDELIGYEVTVEAYPEGGENTDTHHEYIQKVTKGE